MGFVTTHVLDTAQGKPGADITVSLFRIADQRELIKTLQTNADGRTDQPIIGEQEFSKGTYELVFSVGNYFKKFLQEPNALPFLDEIPIRFSISVDDHYHVPLLVSPWSYSTYRGS